MTFFSHLQKGGPPPDPSYRFLFDPDRDGEDCSPQQQQRGGGRGRRGRGGEKSNGKNNRGRGRGGSSGYPHPGGYSNSTYYADHQPSPLLTQYHDSEGDVEGREHSQQMHVSPAPLMVSSSMDASATSTPEAGHLNFSSHTNAGTPSNDYSVSSSNNTSRSFQQSTPLGSSNSFSRRYASRDIRLDPEEEGSSSSSNMQSSPSFRGRGDWRQMSDSGNYHHQHSNNGGGRWNNDRGNRGSHQPDRRGGRGRGRGQPRHFRGQQKVTIKILQINSIVILLDK